MCSALTVNWLGLGFNYTMGSIERPEGKKERKIAIYPGIEV